MQAYYYDEKALLSNEEFDNLKEDLIWAGSKVAVLRYAPQTLIPLCCPAESCTAVHLLCGVQAHLTTAQNDKSSAASYGRPPQQLDGGLP